MRFPSILSIGRPDFIARFQEEIRALYPLVGQLHETVVSFMGPGALSTPQVASSWQFRDPDEKWTVTLSPEALTLETNEYTTFALFGGRFNELVRIAAEAFAPARQDRIGLRYLNEIVHPDARTPAEWRPFLRAELLGVVGGEIVGEDVIRALQEIRVRQPNGIFVLKHGSVRQEDVSSASAYLLDFDYFDETPQPLVLDDLEEKLSSYNDIIYRVFRWSILDPLYEFFEPGEDTVQ